ncbi:unnamed protein product [Gordionus sp. m RMFG-2023]
MNQIKDDKCKSFEPQTWRPLKCKSCFRDIKEHRNLCHKNFHIADKVKCEFLGRKKLYNNKTMSKIEINTGNGENLGDNNETYHDNEVLDGVNLNGSTESIKKILPKPLCILNGDIYYIDVKTGIIKFESIWIEKFCLVNLERLLIVNPLLNDIGYLLVKSFMQNLHNWRNGFASADESIFRYENIISILKIISTITSGSIILNTSFLPKIKQIQAIKPNYLYSSKDKNLVFFNFIKFLEEENITLKSGLRKLETENFLLEKEFLDENLRVKDPGCKNSKCNTIIMKSLIRREKNIVTMFEKIIKPTLEMINNMKNTAADDNAIIKFVYRELITTQSTIPSLKVYEEYLALKDKYVHLYKENIHLAQLCNKKILKIKPIDIQNKKLIMEVNSFHSYKNICHIL